MELFDINVEEPQLQLITDTNDADQEMTNQEIKANYMADPKDWKTRMNVFLNNKRYVYGKVMNMCTTEYMIDKLEQEADFDNKLFNNPKELLKRKPLMKDAGTCMYFTGPISSL